MRSIEILDVAILGSWAKAVALLDKFDHMDSGQRFIFYTNQYPRFLYIHLLKERGRTFGWRFLKKGPDRWEVLISMDLTSAAKKVEKPRSRGALASKKYNSKFDCSRSKTDKALQKY